MKKISSALLLLVFLTACSMASTVRYPAARWVRDRDQEAIQRPAKSQEYKVWDYADKQFFYQLARLGDLPERLGVVASAKQEALNVNNFDEVADSTWFTNRMGRRDLSLEELARGPGTGKGPDPAGPWTILSGKTQGIAAGLVIEDPQKIRYLLKFDPGGNMEMATGAEMISTKILYGAGYNVPENTLVIFEPKILKIDPKATTTDKQGKKRPFTSEDLEDIFSRLPFYHTGHYRAIASQYVPGEPLGPFSFLGRRSGDSNDRIPHEHRRELRGYRVFASLLNHSDSRGGNTLDTFIEEPENHRGYVRHYLIDFGSTLGSSTTRPKQQEHLYDYTFNPRQTAARFLAFGAYTPYWKNAESPDYPALGFFESKVFKPEAWKPAYPNPAFQNMTDRDGFWATKILMNFSDDDIRAIVKEGAYSNPAVSEYIAKTLIERRDKIGQYWFGKLNPLDDFQLVNDSENVAVVFKDLAIRSGFEKETTTSYRYRVRDERGQVTLQEWAETSSPRIAISRDVIQEMKPRKYYGVEIETFREGKRFWSPPVELIFQMESSGSKPQIVGLRRKYSD